MTENFYFEEASALLKAKDPPQASCDNLSQYRISDAHLYLERGNLKLEAISDPLLKAVREMTCGITLGKKVDWRNSPFTFEMDPGFTGGREAIAERYKNEAEVENLLLDGYSLKQIYEKHGQDKVYYDNYDLQQKQALQQAKYNQALRDGLHCQDARIKAGMGRDSDPGFEGGAAVIEWNHKAYAWLKEYLRQGFNLDNAESKAMQKIGPAPER